MYLSVVENKGQRKRLSGDDDKVKTGDKIVAEVRGAEPVMAALPWMGVSGAMLVGTAVIPKDKEWAPVTKLVLAGVGAASAIVGVILALQKQKELKDYGPMGRPVPKGQLIPDVSEGALLRMLPITVDALQKHTDGTVRSSLVDQYFEGTVKNDSKQKISVFPGISIFDEEGKKAYFTPIGPERQEVELEPGQSKTFGTPADPPALVVPSKVAPWALPFGTTYTFRFDLYRNVQDTTPAVSSVRLPFKYFVIG